ncbi:unnamed protein product [Toxocara canis]|uniref:Similar to n=1 Tax=Toxocara canis TaxID=6265 RepID=A0A183UY48_TOXCA|nr:unnamed protein product [Toxocara canis]
MEFSVEPHTGKRSVLLGEPLTTLNNSDNSLRLDALSTCSTLTHDEETSSVHSDTCSTIVDVIRLLKAYDEQMPPAQDKDKTNNDASISEAEVNLAGYQGISDSHNISCEQYFHAANVTSLPTRHISAVRSDSVQQRIINCYIWSMEQDDARILKNVAQFEEHYCKRRQQEKSYEATLGALSQMNQLDMINELIRDEYIGNEFPDGPYLEERHYNFSEWTPWEAPAIAPWQTPVDYPGTPIIKR